MAQPIDIQIERSLTNTPTTLLYGEPAWDDTNETLYIGRSDGTPIAIGGNNPTTNKKAWAYGGSIESNNIKTDIDFNQAGGLSYAIAPASVPTPSTLYYISTFADFNNRGYEAHVFVNGVSVANLAVPAGTLEATGNFVINVNQDDQIRLRLIEIGTGNNRIDFPNMYAYFIEQ